MDVQEIGCEYINWIQLAQMGSTVGFFLSVMNPQDA